ncbi:hypothetical protein [Streptomyces sp. bgisy060]|uniref:hypothetical protein n=1 Tax=Streptomyces sp. bgisy060 TaxID=3413775 RepID=UPI003EBD2CCE
MSSDIPDTTIDTNDVLFADLVRLWAARSRGLPRPAPPKDPAHARILVDVYEKRAERFAAEGHHRAAGLYRERANEIHRSL